MNHKVEYNPTPIYNRRIIRDRIRASVIKRDGYHDVSAKVHDYFARYQEHIHNK